MLTKEVGNWLAGKLVSDEVFCEFNTLSWTELVILLLPLPFTNILFIVDVSFDFDTWLAM